jgi:flagellar hook-associated protein 3 FlgL
MTILSTSAFFERAGLDISNLRQRAQDLQSQVSSGERLARPSDDPVASARLRVLGRADDLTSANRANANRAMADLTLTDQAISEVADNLMRAQELAIQAANDTLSPAQRAVIGQQLSDIRENLIALANMRDGAGHSLLGGEATGAAYVVDGAGIPVYSGTSSAGELPLGDGQSVVRGVTGPELFNFTHSGSPTDLFAVIGTLADALQAGLVDPALASRDALGAMNTGLEQLTTTQTIIGARMNWVDINLSRYDSLEQMRAGEESDHDRAGSQPGQFRASRQPFAVRHAELIHANPYPGGKNYVRDHRDRHPDCHGLRRLRHHWRRARPGAARAAARNADHRRRGAGRAGGGQFAA